MSSSNSWSTYSASSQSSAAGPSHLPAPSSPRMSHPQPHKSSPSLLTLGPTLSYSTMSESTMNNGGVPVMLPQRGPLTPAPSPGASSTSRLWGSGQGFEVGSASSREGGGRGMSIDEDVSSLDDRVRMMWGGPSRAAGGTAPHTLMDTFQSLSLAERFQFLSLLVPQLRMDEASAVSRRIEPRLKRDFMKDLPGELALHCLSFITDAHTLTQAAQVSQYWYSLLQDEQTWKDMCEWHRFTPIITPLSTHRSSAPRTIDSMLSSANTVDRPRRWSRDVDTGPGATSPRLGPGRGADALILGPVHSAGLSQSTSGLDQYYIPLSTPVGPHPALRDFAKGFKAQFKDAYQTQRNWYHGGRVIKQFIAVSEDDGVVTSLAINNHYMIVGMANSRIHIFEASTSRYKCTLYGHERGVWTLVLVSPSQPEPGDDDYPHPTSSSYRFDSTSRSDTSNMTSSLGYGARPPPRAGLAQYRDDGLSRRASTGAGMSGWGTPPTQSSAESPTTYHPPNVGFDPNSAPAAGRYTFGPTTPGSTSHHSAPPDAEGLAGSSSGSGPGRRGAKIHPTKRMRSSDICGSARGWSETGMGARHLVVSGGCDRHVKVWDVATGACIHSLGGHESTIRCLKVLDRRPIAISGSRDKSLRVWDIHKGKLLRQLVGHTGSVRCVEIAGNMAVSGSYDNTARVWNVDTGDCIHVLHGHYHQIYSCGFDGERIITGSLDSTVRVWSAATGACLALLHGHTSLVGQIQLVGDRLLTGGSDGRVIIFDLANYECLHRLCAHDNSVTCLQFDDRYIISGGMDGRVKLWDVRTGTFIRELTRPCTSVWRIACKDDRVVILAQRGQRTVLETLTFRPGELLGKPLVVS